MCYVIIDDYQHALEIYKGLLARKPKKNVYILLSVCYKKLEEYQNTEKIVKIV